MLSTLLLVAEEDSRDKIIYLYKTFHREMMIFAKSRLKAAKRQNYATEAEDVVQNAFVKLVKYIYSIDFTRSEDALRVYVLSVTENELSSYLDKERDIALGDDLIDVISENAFWQDLAVEEYRRKIEEVLMTLDEKYTVVLVLHFLEERSLEEIATFLGISKTAVCVRLAKAKEAFKKKIKEGV